MRPIVPFMQWSDRQTVSSRSIVIGRWWKFYQKRMQRVRNFERREEELRKTPLVKDLGEGREIPFRLIAVWVFFFLRISAPSPSSLSQNHHIDGCCIIRMTPLPLSLRRFPRHSDTIWVTNYPHLIFPDWTVFDIFSRCFSFKIFVEHWDIWWMS